MSRIGCGLAFGCFVLLLAAASAVDGKEPYHGDFPLYRCAGHDEFDAHGNHWLRSGEDGDNPDTPRGEGVYAAMHWVTGRYDETTDDLVGVTHRCQVVPPRGVRLPVGGIGSSIASEVRACWVLRRLEDGEPRPQKIKDSRRPLQLTCETLPPELSTELPALTQIGRVLVEARKGRIHFFGAELPLVPHDGSAYVGISRDFAVSLHKTTGAFRIVLPQGRGLEGACRYPEDAD